jgi:hypothetical protein
MCAFRGHSSRPSHADLCTCFLQQGPSCSFPLLPDLDDTLGQSEGEGNIGGHIHRVVEHTRK